MITPLGTETALVHDVERLRERFSQTQDLYREVCAVLFFRYGITPTTNKLYQLVRKGSMSAPSQALAAFWQELREKSRVRIEHPDLPEGLASTAGELVATLWTSAQAAAHESLAALRQDAEAVVQRIKAEMAVLEREKEGQAQTIGRLESELTLARQELAKKHDDLVVAAARQSSLESALNDVKGANAQLQHQLEEARLQFAAELEKLREAARFADERTRATEKRLLLDIDRERTLQAAARKETEALVAEMRKLAEQHKHELASLQQALGAVRHDNGKLQGALSAATQNLSRTETRLAGLQEQLHHEESRVAVLQARLADVREQKSSGHRRRKGQPGAKTLLSRRSAKV
ncbi:MAG: DNA-binding protein [Pusillimonas sp.]